MKYLTSPSTQQRWLGNYYSSDRVSGLYLITQSISIRWPCHADGTNKHSVMPSVLDLAK